MRDMLPLCPPFRIRVVHSRADPGGDFFAHIFNRHSIHSGQPFEKHFSFQHIHLAANSIVLSGISYS